MEMGLHTISRERDQARIQEGWQRIFRFPPPFLKAFWTKMLMISRKLTVLLSNAIIKPKNLNLNNGYLNIECHFEVNRLQSIGKYMKSEGPG